MGSFRRSSGHDSALMCVGFADTLECSGCTLTARKIFLILPIVTRRIPTCLPPYLNLSPLLNSVLREIIALADGLSGRQGGCFPGGLFSCAYSDGNRPANHGR